SFAVRVDELPDPVKCLIGIANVANADAAAGDIAEAKRGEWPEARARPGRQRGKVNGAEAIDALQDSFAHRHFFHIAKSDDFLVDREKSFLELKMILKKPVLGAAVVQALAEIGDEGNRDKGNGTEEDERRA